VPACCPACASNRVARSHARWHELPRRWLTGRVPYQCAVCPWRGWQLAITDRRRYWRIRPSAIFRLILLCGFIGGVFWISRHSVKSSEDAVLSILSARAYQSQSGDVWHVEGQIQNLTKHPLANIQVAVTWYDTRGVVIATSVSLVDLERLTPGAFSGYRTSTHTVKGMSRFEVQFQSDLGQRLLVRGDQQGSIDTPATSEHDTSGGTPTSGVLSSKTMTPP
jgi:hypothetical protein